MTVFEAIKSRRSVRKFLDKPVEVEKLAVLWEALRLSPSACNIQPWHYVLLENKSVRERLVAECTTQKFILEAPLVLVGCANEQIAYPRMGGYMSSFAIDLTIGFTQLMLVAQELGLGTCWIGSFNEAAVKQFLQIPDPWRVVAMTPIGYAAETSPIKARKTWAEISSKDVFEE